MSGGVEHSGILYAEMIADNINEPDTSINYEINKQDNQEEHKEQQQTLSDRALASRTASTDDGIGEEFRPRGKSQLGSRKFE